MNKNTQTIALLSDIHGNINALTALMQYYDNVGYDIIINLGDIVNIGAHSRQCLDTMLALPNCINLMGNHDYDFVLDRRQHQYLSHTSAEHKAYVFDTIGQQYIDKVSCFAHSHTITHGDKIFTFVHYALSDSQEYLFRPLVPAPTAQLLDQTFADMTGDVIFYGHKHEPSSFVGNKVYHDIGSVGCHRDSVARGALLVLDEDGSYTFSRVAVPYDRYATYCEMTNGTLPSGQYLFDFYYDRIGCTEEER